MKELFDVAKSLALLTGVGIYLAIVLGICVYIGILVDNYFTLNNTGKIIGILVGFPIAIYSIYRQIIKNNKSDK